MMLTRNRLKRWLGVGNGDLQSCRYTECQSFRGVGRNVRTCMALENAKQQRRAAGKLSHLSLDLPDSSVRAQKPSRSVALPLIAEEVGAGRVIRHLMVSSCCNMRFEFLLMPTQFDVYTGRGRRQVCSQSRRATSGCAVMHGCHLISD